MKQQLLFSIGLMMFLVSCTKSNDNANIKLASNMLINKTWYLDYSVTANKTKTYLGQQTYFINFIDFFTASDSDGINGTYSLSNVDGKLVLNFSGKTASGNTIISNYLVESVGYKNMVLSFVSSGITTKQYYTTR